MSSSSLCYSANYVWSINAILGKGATGFVYQGTCKANGEQVAVKTFNNSSPDQVQIREFELLQRVNHENIVRLLAVEEELDQKSRCRIIVMELCSGGSLFTVLDDPENTYGLEEDEFLLVLNHISNGMKHLRDNNIVHRDLKPGNIIKYITDDGRSIYKLTDFGAARELADDQRFMSLYGTEEYLHPDLYERAVLRNYISKSFGATVDLWSIGVTFYHVATGSLPFRPFGGRENRETMFKITTQKASGIISGVQHALKGPIEWNDKLPATCQLSMGLQKHVTPILSGLMECNADLMWSFDLFFSNVTSLLEKRRFHIFYVDLCQMLTIYVDASQKLENFKLLVQQQTNVLPERQRMFFAQKSFDEVVNRNTLIRDYPSTTREEPIFVVGSVLPIVSFTQPLQTVFPTFSSAVSLDQDAADAKLICSNSYVLKRNIEKTGLIFKLLKSFAQTMNNVVKDQFTRLKSYIDQAEAKSISAMQKTKMLQSRHKTTTALLDQLEAKCKVAISEERNKLNILVNSKQESNSTVTKQLNIVRTQLSSYQNMINEDHLWNQWKDTATFKNDLSKCPSYAHTYVRILRSCWQNFERNRRQRTSPHMVQEPWNMLERLRVEDNKQKLCQVYQEQCLPAVQTAVGELSLWLSGVQRVINNGGTDEDLQRLVDMLSVHDSTLDKANETYDEIVHDHVIQMLSPPTHSMCNGVSESLPNKSINTKMMFEKLKSISDTHSETMELLEINQSMLTKFREVASSINDLYEKSQTS